ncbi:MAG: PIN domain-containing protein [Cryobacterium sp.]|nr:PIN domain-containing protein [Cryobacterium sp.]
MLIYSILDDARGAAARRSLLGADGRLGSNLLLVELLRKPMRAGLVDEVRALEQTLATMELRPADDEVVEAALSFSVKYGLKTRDAIHLATAVVWGAARFHTNNRKHFGPHITEVEVVHPSPAVG